MFTEDQIREVLAAHYYTPGDHQGERNGLCSCKYNRPEPVLWSIGHVIDELKAL